MTGVGVLSDLIVNLTGIHNVSSPAQMSDCWLLPMDGAGTVDGMNGMASVWVEWMDVSTGR